MTFSEAVSKFLVRSVPAVTRPVLEAFHGRVTDREWDAIMREVGYTKVEDRQ